MIERYRHDDADQCFGKDFISIDPGEDGACVLFKRGQPTEVIHTALDVRMIADSMGRHGVEVMIMERQFVKMNASSALELAWRTGMMIGAVANELGDLHMVEVYPSTWQAHQRRQFNITNKLNRKQGIQLSLDAAKVMLSEIWEDQVAIARKPVIEGIASASGMASWWLGVQDGE